MCDTALAGTRRTWGHNQDAELQGCPGGRSGVSHGADCSDMSAGGDPAPGQGCAQLVTHRTAPQAICRGSCCKGSSVQMTNELQLIYYQHSCIHLFTYLFIRARTGGCHKVHREQGSVLALRSSWPSGDWGDEGAQTGTSLPRAPEKQSEGGSQRRMAQQAAIMRTPEELGGRHWTWVPTEGAVLPPGDYSGGRDSQAWTQ